MTLLLVDGHNLLFRSYCVPFKFFSPKGTPLHVVTTFLKQLRRAVAITAPSQVVVVFDKQGVPDKVSLDANYKANRKQDYSQDEDSSFQHLPYIKQMLSHLGITHVEPSEYEADDLIASYAAHATAPGNKATAIVCSNDSDFYQLVSSRVQQLLLRRKDQFTFIDPSWVLASIGVMPEQYVYFKSLTGDPSDNIAGVPGIGKVRAARIINQELTVDLTPHQELLAHNERLIKLNDSLPLPQPLSQCDLPSSQLWQANQVLWRELQL